MSYDESRPRDRGVCRARYRVAGHDQRGHRDIAYQFFVQPPQSANQLVRLGGLDEVGALPGVEQLAVNRRVGDVTNWRNGSLEYVLWVRGSVPDRDALRTIPAQMHAKLQLEYC